MYLVYGMTDRIRVLLRDRNITVTEFSRRIKMPRATVARILAMERTPSVKFVVRTAKTLGVTADFLFDGREE